MLSHWSHLQVDTGPIEQVCLLTLLSTQKLTSPSKSITPIVLGHRVTATIAMQSSTHILALSVVQLHVLQHNSCTSYKLHLAPFSNACAARTDSVARTDSSRTGDSAIRGPTAQLLFIVRRSCLVAALYSMQQQLIGTKLLKSAQSHPWSHRPRLLSVVASTQKQASVQSW